jgi:hypothetical protein
MTSTSAKRLNLAAFALALLVSDLVASADAAAGCLRRIYNRSSFVLVARQDGGTPTTIMPGRSLSVRLLRPGKIDLSAYCGVPRPGGEFKPIVEDSFDYGAQIDRCFIRFGGQLFVPQLGRGFIGLHGTAPFTVNNPRQGDLILWPSSDQSCPVLRSGG